MALHKPSCPAEITMTVIAGRWKLMVIYWLMKGTRRFNALQRDLGGITHRTLSKTLKEMEEDGLVQRYDHGKIPPRVDYSLTPKGEALAPILDAMQDWAVAHAEGASTAMGRSVTK
jgi:DNA-binding HxlR family transcriptional regulator